MDIKFPLLHFYFFLLFASKVAIDGVNCEILEKVFPIIIKTPLTNYQQPSFDDYKNCMKELDDCKAACNSNAAAATATTDDCLAKCKKCPLLIKQNVIVQGVNDTSSYAYLQQKTMNSTNVFCIKNEIHNIIENNLGDVLSKNTNNIQIYTTEQNNSSTTCDKYGLGCNQNGSTCCYILKNYHRQLHCGTRCQARIMYQRTKVQCLDETNMDSCRKIIEYKPLRLKKSKKHTTAKTATAVDNYKCRYDSNWPFVNCRNRKDINERCSPICLSLSYLYILQHGIPLQCTTCYKSFGQTTAKEFVQPFIDENQPSFDHHAYGDGDDDHDEKNWILEQSKCRLPNGTISENCGSNNKQIVAKNDRVNNIKDNNNNEVTNVNEFVPPPINTHDDNENHSTLHDDDKEWILEQSKCRLQNGTLSENCGGSNNNSNNNDKNPILNDNDQNEFGSGNNDGNDIIVDDPVLEPFNALEDSSKQQNSFQRSKYSLRHRQKFIRV